MTCYHLLIKGKVQGVFFRQTAKSIARQNKLNGWIRNTPEGNVEVKICGEEEGLQKFISWSRTGPEQARVENVQITESDIEEFDDFSVRRRDE